MAEITQNILTVDSKDGTDTGFTVRGLSGLINIGNTCYLNATLQVLCNTDMLVAYFIHNSSPIKVHIKNRILDLMVIDLEKKMGKQIDNIDMKEISELDSKMTRTVTYWLRQIMKYMWSENSEIRPIKFKKMVSQYFPDFGGMGQHDSHELLTKILDRLHEETASQGKFSLKYDHDTDQYARQIKQLHNQIDSTADVKQKSELLGELMRIKEINTKLFFEIEFGFSLKKMFDESYSIVNEIFTGITCTKTKCVDCGFENISFERSDMLDLCFPEEWAEPSISLDKLIDGFFVEEKMTSENQIVCSKCNTKKDATRSGCIFYSPNKLIINLKKYKTKGNNNFQKINTKVEYNHNLDISRWTFSQEPTEYELYATIRHSGPYGGGHYFAFCKNPISKLWYIFDDADVYNVDDDEVLKSNSYILFYQRK